MTPTRDLASYYDKTSVAGRTPEERKKMIDRTMVRLTANAMAGAFDDNEMMVDSVRNTSSYYLRRSSAIVWG